MRSAIIKFMIPALRTHKVGFNLKTDETLSPTRRRIKVDLELPMKEEYRALVEWVMEGDLRNRAISIPFVTI